MTGEEWVRNWLAQRQETKQQTSKYLGRYVDYVSVTVARGKLHSLAFSIADVEPVPDEVLDWAKEELARRLSGRPQNQAFMRRRAFVPNGDPEANRLVHYPSPWPQRRFA